MADQIVPSGYASLPQTMKDMGDGTFAVLVAAQPQGSQLPASGAAVVSVASAAANTLLKPANANRKGVIITNDSTSVLYVLLGAGNASAANYTFAIPAKGTVAADRTITGYTGVVQGIWSAANGNALVTELV